MTMFLRPIESNHLTQRFGENTVCARTRPGGFPILPYSVVDKVNGVCPPGTRDFYRLLDMLGHNGGDWAAWMNEPTYHCALFKGKARMPVDKSGKPSSDGGIEVVSIDPILECTAGCPKGTMHHVVLRYAHGVPAVKAGTIINPGDLVQRAGNIGSSSGVHVHWAPKWADANGNFIHTDNGYEGAFDYAPWFVNAFVIDYLRQEARPTPQPVPMPVDLTTVEKMKKALFQASVWLSSYTQQQNKKPVQ